MASTQGIHVAPPLFVLGHWRSGTTYLHNLLTVDRRFGFPNNYQALFPHTFLTMESIHSPFIQRFLPRTRPMDNIEWTMQSPQEDEFALCITTFKSPCMGWCFPERRDDYDRYLTLRDVDASEVEVWKLAFMTFLKRLTAKEPRPLVLKSPPHTCRIKLLLGLFPNARFVHVHRNPYAVFQSTRQMLKVNFGMHGLQRPRVRDLDDWILRQYRTMYDTFFEERVLIPEGHFCEVRFEELERNPIGQLERVYGELGLPPFAETRSTVEGYARSVAGYRKNEHVKLTGEQRERIRELWRPSFDQWKYPLE